VSIIARLFRRRREHHAIAKQIGGWWFVYCPDCARECRRCHGRRRHGIAVTAHEDDATLAILDHQLDPRKAR